MCGRASASLALQVYPLQAGGSCAYVLAGPAGAVLIDAGLRRDGAKILRVLQRLAVPLRLIFITHAHADHYGGAAAVQRATGAPIAIHRADAEALAHGQTQFGAARGRGRWLAAGLISTARMWQPPAITPDILLQDGDHLDAFSCDAVVLHTPGHTPGSATLWAAGQWAFVGDLLSSTGRPHAQRYFATDWAALAASVRRVQALQPALIYPGHGRRAVNQRELALLSG